MVGAVRVRGLRELQRDLKLIDAQVAKEIRAELKDVAEPVRARAVQNALADISHIGERWSQMRIGVTTRMVYVAPKARRRGGTGQPNLAPLLGQAMETALAENEDRVVAGLEHALDRAVTLHGF